MRFTLFAFLLVVIPVFIQAQAVELPSSIYAGTRRINAVDETSQALWAGTSGGLVRRDKTTGEVQIFTPANAGLKTLSITSLLAENDNSLWIGTGTNKWYLNYVVVPLAPSSGIYQYTGTQWRHFGKADCAALGASVWAIERQGELLWVGTEQGLCRYDGTSWTLFKKPVAGNPAPTDSGLPDNKIFSLYADPNGSLWVGTGNGLVIYRPDGSWVNVPLGTWTNPASLPPGQINSIVPDQQGDVWICTFGGIGRFPQGDYTSLEKFTKPVAYKSWLPLVLTIDASNTKWLGTNQGVLSFDNTNWQAIPRISQQLQGDFIGEIKADDDNSIWCGIDPEHSRGLYAYKNQQWSEVNVSKVPLSDYAVENTSNILTHAPDNTRWIGAYEYGVATEHDGTWDLIRPTTLGGVSDFVYSIASDVHGGRWIAGDKKVFRYSSGSWETFDIYTSANLNLMANLFPGKQRMIVAMYNSIGLYTPETGLQVINGPTPGPFATATSGPGFSLTRIDVLRESTINDDLWAMSTKGIVQISNGVWTTYPSTITKINTSQHFFNSAYVPPALTIDKYGYVWAGTNNGVARYDGTAWSYFNTSTSSLPSNRILTIHAEPSGVVWIGTDRGAVRVEEAQWRLYNRSNSALPSDTVNTITSARGQVWLGTTNGVANVKNTQLKKLQTTLPYQHITRIQADTSMQTLYVQTRYNALAIIENVFCDLPASVITASGPLAFCEGDSVVLTGPEGAASYRWSDGSHERSVTIHDTRTLTLQVTDASGCVSPVSESVAVEMVSRPPKPHIQSPGDDFSFCYGTSQFLTGPAGYAGYRWSTGATSQTVTLEETATISLTVINETGCESPESDPVTVTERPELAIDLGEDKTIFYGYPPLACVTLQPRVTAESPYSLYWSTGATSSTLQVCPEATATVAATVRDEGGCEATDDITIHVVNVSCHEHKVAICHRTNSGKWVQLCVAPQSVPAHLAHGDVLGSCTDEDDHVQELPVMVDVSPNPSIDKATIQVVTFTEARHVTIDILTSTGQKVANLFSGSMNAGEEYRCEFSSEGRPGGLYLCRVVINGREHISRIQFTR